MATSRKNEQTNNARPAGYESDEEYERSYHHTNKKKKMSNAKMKEKNTKIYCHSQKELHSIDYSKSNTGYFTENYLEKMRKHTTNHELQSDVDSPIKGFKHPEHTNTSNYWSSDPEAGTSSKEDGTNQSTNTFTQNVFEFNCD